MSACPEVSIVIPAYNAAATVGAAVESVLRQSLASTQVIVVDDGSTDATAGVLACYGDDITVVRQENGGLASARSAGQAVATGEFIAWLDADDVAVPERLEVQVAVLRAEPEVVVVASDFDAFDDSGKVTPRFARAYHGSIAAPGSLGRIFGAPRVVEAAGRRWPYHSGDARRHLVFGNFMHPPTVMIRRSAIDRVGPLNGAFAISEDWLYFVELSALGHLAFIDEPLIEYRLSPGQMSRNVRTVLENNLKALEYVLARNPDLAAREADKVRRSLGHRHRSLAIHLVDFDRAAAARHLLEATRLDPFAKELPKAFFKIVTPGVALRAYRWLKSTRTASVVAMAAAFATLS
jgi:glycosyltransferase involved in cell wall biosynthesis